MKTRQECLEALRQALIQNGGLLGGEQMFDESTELKPLLGEADFDDFSIAAEGKLGLDLDEGPAQNEVKTAGRWVDWVLTQFPKEE